MHNGTIGWWHVSDNLDHSSEGIPSRNYGFVWLINYMRICMCQLACINLYYQRLNSSTTSWSFFTKLQLQIHMIDWLHTNLYVIFLFSFFLFSFLQPCLHYHNGDFLQILDTATHILVFWPALLCLASWHSFSATQLAFVWQFLGKSLNLSEFKTTSNGGNHSRSHHFPFLKPTNSVIPY